MKEKRVFKGTIFEVWQWRQKLYDGSTKIFERIRRPNTIEVIPVVGDKVLIQIQRQPHWKRSLVSVPGGRVDDGEALLAAARRELREETGYGSKEWKLWKTYRPSTSIVWSVSVYIARNCARTFAPTPDAGEKIRVKLVSFDEFLALADNPRFRNYLLLPDLLRARYVPAEYKKLRRLLFGT